MKTRAITLLICLAFVRPALALTPGDLSRVKFEQHSGQQISRDLAFEDETGRTLDIGELFGKRPLILVPGYYRCPMLCTMINDGLINTLENLRGSVGRDFDVVDVSIDPSENAEAAAEKQRLYVRRYGRPGSSLGWHCLVGNQQSIAQLADEIGYRYAYDSQLKQYAHPSGVIILTPDGRISRYISGVTFNSTELRDALAAAEKGESSSAISEILLLCYHYNPITGKYGHLILSILRFASVGFVALMAWWVVWMTRRPSNQSAQTG
jgi:protein SCO1